MFGTVQELRRTACPGSASESQFYLAEGQRLAQHGQLGVFDATGFTTGPPSIPGYALIRMASRQQ